MPRYRVKTDQGTFALEVDQAIPDTPQGRAVMQRLVAHQLAEQESRAFAQRDFPVATAVGDIGRGVVGGMRDAAQQIIEVPVSILNTITEFISPDPPGPPGSRRRLVPEVAAPQLPDFDPPRPGLERGVRTGTNITTDAALALLVPGMRRALARRLRILGSGFKRPRQGVPLMFETTHPQFSSKRAVARQRPGQPAIKTLATVESQPPLLRPLSEGAKRTAKLFDISINNTGDVITMTLEQATQARRRILSRLGVDGVRLAEQPNTPIGELMQVIEAQILRHR